MKLIERHSSDQFMHDPEFGYTQCKWRVWFDENDLSPKMRDRFMNTIVEQRVKRHGEWRNGEKVLTWFQGTRTNIFDHDTKDKEKQQIIRMVEEFLVLQETDPLISLFKPNNQY